MVERAHDPRTAIALGQVGREEEFRRILGRVYAILLGLAEEETAGSGDTAANHSPEPAATDMALLGVDELENQHAHSSS